LGDSLTPAERREFVNALRDALSEPKVRAAIVKIVAEATARKPRHVRPEPPRKP
jgi:hypothetical protein